GCVASGPALADSDACRSAIGDLIGPCGTFLTAWSTSFGDPEGVAVDGSGNVFVADAGNFVAGAGNTRIDKFDNAGVFLTSWSTLGSGPGQFHLPLGVAVDGSGNVFIADASSDGSGTKRIQKFDGGGTYLTAWGSFGTGPGQFNGPNGVAVDGSGNVFVADGSNTCIQKFDNARTCLTTWGTPGIGLGQFRYPFGVAVDGSGNVFVADADINRTQNQIQKFDNVGTFLTAWGTSAQFRTPAGLAVDGSG